MLELHVLKTRVLGPYTSRTNNVGLFNYLSFRLIAEAEELLLVFPIQLALVLHQLVELI